MVVMSKPNTGKYTYVRNSKPAAPAAPTFLSSIPLVDLSKPDAKSLIVKACEDFGFFKVINHGVPMDAITRLESEAASFFSLPLHQKQKAGPANPFGYGNKHIGRHGDIGWVEYLLLKANQDYNPLKLSSVSGEDPENFRSALNDYMTAVRKMACDILDLMAEGLNIQPKNAFSRLVNDKQSDSVFRLNHYPPCPELAMNGGNEEDGDKEDDKKTENKIGFGEHTDPQIIALLRSNNTSGLQISLKDGTWISVPPDQTSFFVNVGDSLQVMTNGRFKSVKHRVLANRFKSRLSMIYFAGPPLNQKIAPLPSLILTGKESLYKEFTWFEYKTSAYGTRLADNRLCHFERIAAS